MRYANWYERVHKVIEAAGAGETPFQYGSYNCGAFAARCIDAEVIDSAREAELCSHFTDEATCRAWIDSQGGIEPVVTARLGEPIPWWKAIRGDVCLMPTAEGPGMGVNMGDAVAMLTPNGIGYVKIDKAIKCWSVA